MPRTAGSGQGSPTRNFLTSPLDEVQTRFLKLSGESLMGEKEFWIDHTRLRQYAEEIKRIVDKGAETAIVIGGGNIFRGVGNDAGGVIDRAQGRLHGHAGDGHQLHGAAKRAGRTWREDPPAVGDQDPEQICEPYIRRRAIRHLEKDVSSSSAPAPATLLYDRHGCLLRAVSGEINADVILKGARGWHLYSRSGERQKCREVRDRHLRRGLRKGLKIMDLTAFTLCNENKVPIIVFDMNKPGNLLRVMEGQQVGTLVEF